jgi:5-methylthioadenosine/S-adenosylhomocysteine deaminase
MMNSDILIKNALLWPSAGAEVTPNGSVLIQNGRITKMGSFKAYATTTIDADGALLMPGFIQTHVHLCQTIFRGIGEDLALLPWLRGYIWPMEAAHDPESIRCSAELACAELIRSGTTAFMSMETVRHTEVAFQAVKSSGLMGTICHCLMDESGGYGPLAVSLDEALPYCDVLLDHWEDDDNLRLGIAPRFALSCTSYNIQEAAEFARDRSLMLHTHASEQREEVALVYEETGMRNIAYLDSVGLTGPDVGLAHCVHTDANERALLADTGTRVLHCPSANFKLGSGVAPIPEYLAQDISVSIGADGTPCNNRLDMFLEMRLAGLMQQPRLGPGCLSAKSVVRMATEGGAEALNRETEMGTLEVGKRANLILVDQESCHVLPSTDPATNVVYANLSSDVLLTMVNGEILYEEGAFTTIDFERLKNEVVEQRERLETRAGLRS